MKHDRFLLLGRLATTSGSRFHPPPRENSRRRAISERGFMGGVRAGRTIEGCRGARGRGVERLRKPQPAIYGLECGCEVGNKGAGDGWRRFSCAMKSR